MNLNEQNLHFQAIDNKFNEASSIYKIHTIRINAMSAYFNEIRSIYSNYFAKKDEFYITKSSFGKLIVRNEKETPIAPGNPSFQLKNAEILKRTTKIFINIFEKSNELLRDNIVHLLNQYAEDRKNKYEEITKKYKDALKRYTNAQDVLKKSQQELTSSITKLDQTRQNCESQQNQLNVPQKGGFNLFHKLKSKSKTDISGAIQNYRKSVRAVENNIYALNESYSILIYIAKDGISKFESDAPERHKILRQTLSQLSNLYSKAISFHKRITDFKDPLLNNDEQYFYGEWKKDFITFIQKKIISRRPLHSIVFYPNGNQQQNSPQVKCYDFPLGFATVIHNFPFMKNRHPTHPDLSVDLNAAPTQNAPVNQEPRRQSYHLDIQLKNQNDQSPLQTPDENDKKKKYYLQAKKGQRIYYFNNLYDEWVLASLSVNGPRKYILSSCLQDDETNIGYGIVTHVYLNRTENSLNVLPGELLSILKQPDENDDVHCAKITGETGMVKNECLYIFAD